MPFSIKSPHLILLILLIRGSTTRMQSTKIELKELVFFARHGVLAEEAALGQRFRVDVVASLDPSLDLTQDRPESTVNYVELFEPKPRERSCLR